jgi:hypothetical protein
MRKANLNAAAMGKFWMVNLFIFNDFSSKI